MDNNNYFAVVNMDNSEVAFIIATKKDRVTLVEARLYWQQINDFANDDDILARFMVTHEVQPIAKVIHIQ